MRVVGVSRARPGQRDNEDLLATADGLVVVLDGCGVADSMAGSLRRGCVHGVPWYVRNLADALVVSAADPRVPLVDALADAIGTVTDAHRDTCDLTNPDTPASTVAMLREHDGLIDHLVLSDSSVVFDDRPAGGIEVVCDNQIAHAMPRFPHPPLGTKERAVRDARASKARTALLNRPDGFWVASTDPAAATHARTGTRPVAGLAGALVASDGGVRLREFDELDWPALLDLVAADGPAALVERTRAAETADPAGVRWPRGKQYDDATVAYCTFP